MTNSKARIQIRELTEEVVDLKRDLKETKAEGVRDTYIIKELETKIGMLRSQTDNFTKNISQMTVSLAKFKGENV